MRLLLIPAWVSLCSPAKTSKCPLMVSFTAPTKVTSGNGMSQFVITFVTFIVMRAKPLATAVRWWETSIAFCSRVACFSILVRSKSQRASCGCFTRRLHWHFWQSKQAAEPALALRRFWLRCPKNSTPGYHSSLAVKRMWREWSRLFKGDRDRRSQHIDA